MVFFQSALQIWKSKVNEKPAYINAQLMQPLKIPPHEAAVAAKAFCVRGPLIYILRFLDWMI